MSVCFSGILPVFPHKQTFSPTSFPVFEGICNSLSRFIHLSIWIFTLSVSLWLSLFCTGFHCVAVQNDIGDVSHFQSMHNYTVIAYNNRLPEPEGILLCCRKQEKHLPKEVFFKKQAYSPKPMGFLDCQFQESRHISTRVFSAFQPSSSADLAGSA